jgi:RNA polymerase sigma factor (sigma-70 family)
MRRAHPTKCGAANRVRSRSRFEACGYKRSVGPGRSDAELLAASHGARDAFTEFYRRYEQMILAYFSRRVADPELTADLCAETFAAALIGAPGYRPERDTAAPWLFGIARNQLNNSLRARRIQASARMRLGMREPLVLDDEDLERINQTGSQTAVLALLETLPIGQRDAVRARIFDELSYAEVAERLQCSELVARQRVSRGLSRLREQLEDEA